MDKDSFLTLVEGLPGLTQPMIDALTQLAPKLTDEQREKAAQDLQKADDGIVTAFEQVKKEAEEDGKALSAMEKTVMGAIENEEKSNELATAESQLQDA